MQLGVGQYPGVTSVCHDPKAVELPRKLLLTGVLCFVASGSAAQIYFGVMIALLTLLMLTRFVPYADRSVDLVC